jgi:uncharacterized protein YjbJ (UPF0337 family)
MTSNCDHLLAICSLDSGREGKIIMKPSTEDKTAGKLHEVKGTIKQTVGKLTNDPNLEADGRVESMPAKFRTLSARSKRY